ncbi:MAG: hypothetical protein ACRD3T_21075, partial [Terriglobia bacterium]
SQTAATETKLHHHHAADRLVILRAIVDGVGHDLGGKFQRPSLPSFRWASHLYPAEKLSVGAS